LAEAGVPFEVVPGVSSLSAVPASAGIPVTHRGLASQVTIVSGHDVEALDLRCLARAPGTLVVFMGLTSLEHLADELVRHGKQPSTPAAVVAGGTTAGERVVIAPLDQIAAAAAGLEPPALVVIGDVVALAGVLAGSGTAASAAA
jgi:siroheme synthase